MYAKVSVDDALTSKYFKVFYCILKYFHAVFQLQIQILPVKKTQITNTNTNNLNTANYKYYLYLTQVCNVPFHKIDSPQIFFAVQCFSK